MAQPTVSQPIDKQTEQRYYAQIYSIADADHDGKISGGEGASFLRKSGIPDQLLEKVWEASDANKQGFLMQREFAIAMRLIALAQEGKQISVDQIYNVTTLPKFTDIPLPVMFPSSLTDQEIYKYDNLFLQADLNKDDFVDGLEAKAYFSKGKLNTQQLAKIWELADLEKDGKLSRGEFRVAMHLIYCALKGQPIPDTLPPFLTAQAQTASSQVPLPSQTAQQIPTPTPTMMSNTQMTTPTQYFSAIKPQPQPQSQTTFTPDVSHSFDQSKFVTQHTLPGATFETRANFSVELNNAVTKRKQT